MYLLKHHNSRIKLRNKLTISVEFWALFWKLSSTAAIRGIERGKDVVVMFQFRENITAALYVVSGRHLVALDPFVSSRGLLSTHRIKIHSTGGVRRHNKEYSPKCKVNIFHACMFCATKHSTGHTVKCGRSRDSHSWPTHNIAEQL